MKFLGNYEDFVLGKFNFNIYLRKNLQKYLSLYLNTFLTGDSGGPLFIIDKVGDQYKYVEVGIVSYGDGCAKKYLPGWDIFLKNKIN